MSRGPVVGGAIDDVVATCGAWRIWNLLALQDIRQRYRRSKLGPFWLTLSAVISIGALALVYTKIFNIPVEKYLPFLSIGFICWLLLSAIVTESCGVFVQSESIIKQIPLPFGVHVMRVVWRALISFAHNSVAFVLVLLWMGLNPGLNGLLFVPALLLTTLTGVAFGYLLGGLSARFRDVPLIVGNLMQVLFYVTPVIWAPELLRGAPLLLTANPAYHYLEVLRAPLLGQTGPLQSWLAVGAMTVGSMIAALLFFGRYRKRIAFWL